MPYTLTLSSPCNSKFSLALDKIVSLAGFGGAAYLAAGAD